MKGSGLYAVGTRQIQCSQPPYQIFSRRPSKSNDQGVSWLVALFKDPSHPSHEREGFAGSRSRQNPHGGTSMASNCEKWTPRPVSHAIREALSQPRYPLISPFISHHATPQKAGWGRRSVFNVCDLPTLLRHGISAGIVSGSAPFCKLTQSSRQLPQLPSGNRRPPRTGVCASQRRAADPQNTSALRVCRVWRLRAAGYAVFRQALVSAKLELVMLQPFKHRWVKAANERHGAGFWEELVDNK